MKTQFLLVLSNSTDKRLCTNGHGFAWSMYKGIEK
jgi:hypothetical protein